MDFRGVEIRVCANQPSQLPSALNVAKDVKVKKQPSVILYQQIQCEPSTVLNETGQTARELVSYHTVNSHACHYKCLFFPPLFSALTHWLSLNSHNHHRQLYSTRSSECARLRQYPQYLLSDSATQILWSSFFNSPVWPAVISNRTTVLSLITILLYCN